MDIEEKKKKDEMDIEEENNEKVDKAKVSTKKILRYGYKVVSARYFKKPFDITIYKFK